MAGKIVPKNQRKKTTKSDVELLKKAGVDHWMFDEMKFEDKKKTTD